MNQRKPCGKMRKRLTPYLLGELPPGADGAVRDHLADCEGCRAYAKELASTLDVLRDALAAPAAAPELEPARRARVLSGAAPRRAVIPGPWLHLAQAAALLVILLGLAAGLLLPSLQGARERAALIARNEVSLLQADSLPADDKAHVLGKESRHAAESPPAEPVPFAPGPTDRPRMDRFAQGDAPVPAGSDGGGAGYGLGEGRTRTAAGPDIGAVPGEPSAADAGERLAAGEPAKPAVLSGLFAGRAMPDRAPGKDRPGWEEADASSGVPDPSAALSARARAGGDANAMLRLEGGAHRAPAEKALQPAPPAMPVAATAPVPAPVPAMDALAGGAFVGGTSGRVPEEQEDGWKRPVNKGALGLADAVRFADARRERAEGEEPERAGERKQEERAEPGPRGSGGPARRTAAGVRGRPASAAAAENRENDEAGPAGQTEAPAKRSELLDAPVFAPAGFHPFVDARANAFSTFSIDVDTASYALARRYLADGHRPPPEAVRTEEFVNFFDYAYTPPAKGAFAVHAAWADAPFRPGLQLLQIGVKGRVIGRDQQRRAVLTLVIDTSGSMNTPDRLGLLRDALRLLLGALDPADLVAVVQFDTRARLLLEPTPAARRDEILAAIDGMETSGSTHLEEGLRLGYQVAASAFRGGWANRVLLLSDGVANLGSDDARAILRGVEAYRRQGIFCSVFGFGTGSYNDVMLEKLADKGDGSYAFIDSIGEARRLLVDELAATLHVIARDVKIQVEFDPARVARYRQLGYENRALTREQFRDDTVDAGEVGSGQSVTALYEVELRPGARPGLPLGTVRVRYRDVESGRVVELERRLRDADRQAGRVGASFDFRLAAGAAEFAELLRLSPYAAGTDFAEVADGLRPLALQRPLDQRLQELVRLVQAAGRLPPP